METMTRISNEQLNTCEKCGAWTTGYMYGYSGLEFFSVTEQFEHKQFFCSDICAEQKTGRVVL